MSAPFPRLSRTLAYRHLIGCMALCVGACTSAIDRTPEIEHARFRVGVTTKAAVVNAIGLPIRVDKDAANGTETWHYTGKAQTHGDGVIDEQPVVLECVFAPDGRLLHSIRNGSPR